MTRRESVQVLRAGPALIVGLPGEAVDVDRLMAHLGARAVEGGVHVADHDAEGLLWIGPGAAGEAWFFEAGGTETVLSGEPGRELFRQMAARGGTVSVHPGAVPVAQARAPDVPATPVTPEPAGAEQRRPQSRRSEPARRPEPVRREVPAPDVDAVDDPAPQPWPAILEVVADRVARHRGQRLAARFIAALEAALAPYGGRVDGGRIDVPPLPRSTWRVIVETACATVVAVAGRAFVDRTIAAAERDIMRRQGDRR